MSKFSAITDFHAHILPGADHGSDSLETSAEQLKILYSAGVRRVVATPHFYPNAVSVETFLKKRSKAINELCTLEGEGLPAVYVGAEVLVCPGIERMPGLEKLCIYGTNVLLLEMPFTKWSEELYETVYNVSRMDFRVIMAHIGRYPSHQAERIISECGVSVQLNGENISTRHGKHKVNRWLEAGIVSAFGSDIHGASKSAAKNLREIYDFSGEYAEGIGDKCNELLSGAKTVRFK